MELKNENGKIGRDVWLTLERKRERRGDSEKVEAAEWFERVGRGNNAHSDEYVAVVLEETNMQLKLLSI